MSGRNAVDWWRTHVSWGGAGDHCTTLRFPQPFLGRGRSDGCCQLPDAATMHADRWRCMPRTYLMSCSTPVCVRWLQVPEAVAVVVGAGLRVHRGDGELADRAAAGGAGEGGNPLWWSSVVT